MAFTLDRKSFYYTDSLAREIYLFNYNLEDGSISDRRVFARFDEADGLPDGATLDSQGRLWCALWDGASIARLSADGKIAERINLPTPQVSSLTFGGDDNSDIYITTAGGSTSGGHDPVAGALFRIRAQVPGVPEFFSHIEVPAIALPTT
jgi:D-xylonolactonase